MKELDLEFWLKPYVYGEGKVYRVLHFEDHQNPDGSYKVGFLEKVKADAERLLELLKPEIVSLSLAPKGKERQYKAWQQERLAENKAVLAAVTLDLKERKKP